MPYYKNLRGDSGIHSYDITNNGIIVHFNNGGSYEYTYARIGRKHLENMKKLALQGYGLNGYINQNVKNKYSRKF